MILRSPLPSSPSAILSLSVNHIDLLLDLNRPGSDGKGGVTKDIETWFYSEVARVHEIILTIEVGATQFLKRIDLLSVYVKYFHPHIYKGLFDDLIEGDINNAVYAWIIFSDRTYDR